MTTNQTIPAPVSTGEPRHFAFVDALRGWAILCVIAVHSGGRVQEISKLHGGILAVTDLGRFGVQLFFIISAFTLLWSLHERSHFDRKPIRAFFIRRLFRIAPLFWLATAYYLWRPIAWSIGGAPWGIGFPHALLTLLFLHGWYPTTINSVVPGGWSIAAEVMFYLCLPFLFRTIRSAGAAIWMTLLSAVAVVALTPIAIRILVPHFPPGYDYLVKGFVEYSFPSQFPIFACGFVLYFVLMEKPLGWKKCLLPLIVLPAFAFLPEIPGHLWAGLTFLVLTWILARWPISLMVNPVTRFIGKISYSAYIWHFALIDHLPQRALEIFHLEDSAAKFLIVFAAMLLITLPISAVSYFLIEIPGQNLGKTIIKRLQWGRAPRTQISADPLNVQAAASQAT